MKFLLIIAILFCTQLAQAATIRFACSSIDSQKSSILTIKKGFLSGSRISLGDMDYNYTPRANGCFRYGKTSRG